MTNKPAKAFILAAGMGTRLRPYTDTIPKPMVDIAGKSIIHRTLEKLAASGVVEVIVNLHHLAPVMENHLVNVRHPKIILSHEDSLLDTGGGIKKALHYFGDDPFCIINGDALWDEKDLPALDRLADAWDGEKMDILLMLEPVGLMTRTGAVGDYFIDDDEKARRAKDRSGDHMFAGIRIAHPRIFEGSPDGPFSFLTLMDQAEQAGRLYAVPHNAEWYHISTPEDLQRVDATFRAREG